MKTLLLFVLIGFVSISTTSAQKFQVGAELGPNISGAIVKDPGGDPSGKPLFGVQAGAFAGYRFSSGTTGLGARLLYSYEGYKATVYDTKSTIHVSFVKIPIDFEYHPGGMKGKWVIGLGPYFGLGVGGKYTNEQDGKIKIHFGSDENKDELKRLDIGADLMGGYKINNKLLVRADAEYGIVDYLTPGSTAVASAHTMSFGLTAAYSLWQK